MDRKLKDYLDAERVQYQVLTHTPTFTALETAHATHVHGIELAKSVIVSIDGVMSMAVVPATHWVDLEKVQDLTGADMVDLVDEHDFEQRFTDCESGAMPPFGNLYDMPVYCANELRDDRELVFNAGTHTEAVRMAFDDFARLAKPIVNMISRPRAAATA